MTIKGTILIFGANGQLGFELQRSLSVLAPIVPVARTACDVADAKAIKAILERIRPTVIVNAAAFTAVDQAESHAELAARINTEAPQVMAQVASEIGARLVHYSTDYVFDGATALPYSETDPTSPLSVYGRTKRDGEMAVLAAGDAHLVLRTSWVAGAHGANFVRTILRLANERDALRIVADQIGAPTTASMLADVTAQIITKAEFLGAVGGLYHVTSSNFTSWHGYARHIVQWCAERGMALKATPDTVSPISTSEYPLPAQRPKNSRLDTSKIRRTFGICLPDWKQAIDLLLEQILQDQI